MTPRPASWFGVPVTMVASDGDRVVVALDVVASKLTLAHPGHAVRETVPHGAMPWVCVEVPAGEVTPCPPS